MASRGLVVDVIGAYSGGPPPRNYFGRGWWRMRVSLSLRLVYRPDRRRLVSTWSCSRLAVESGPALSWF